MNAILEVLDAQPLYGEDGPGAAPQGMQYDIAESGELEPIGSVHLVDKGDSYASIYDPGTDKVSTLTFGIDIETLTADPEVVAVHAARAALHQTAETEAELLVLLGEDGFAGIR